MKPIAVPKKLLLLATLVALTGCASTPMTREQKEREALSKAYDTITSGKAGTGLSK